MDKSLSNSGISDLKSAKYSIASVWTLIIIILLSQYFFKILVTSEFNFLSWDVYGYYSYLPFNLIHHDPGMTNMNVVDSIFKQYNPSSTYYQAFRLDNGNWISSYSIGMSFLYLPFFLLACLWAWTFNLPIDGFSTPFQVIISMGMMIYFFIGLFFFRKLLLRYFSDKVTALTLLLLVLSTNIFHEVFNDGLEPHNVLFSFYGILMYYIDSWYRGPSSKNAIKMGAVFGLILMIRGSEIVSFFLVLLWGVKSISDLKQRFVFIFSNIKLYFIAIIFAALVFLPQIIHWKYITGHWYFNNYKMAEGFNLLRPNLIPFFFSFKKGVFIYTPAVIILIGSLFVKKFRTSGMAWPIVTFLMLNTYLISCWLVWWGATSFGSRYFSQSIALFAIPFGFLIAWIFEQKFILRSMFFSLFGIFVFLNVFQTWQFINGIINGDRMTYAYYKTVFLKTSIPIDALNLLEPDLDFPNSSDFPGKDKFNTRTISFLDFDSLNTLFVNPLQLDSTLSYSGKFCLRMDSNFIYSPTLRIPMNELSNKDFVWVGVSFDYFPHHDLKENPASLVVHMTIDGNCRDFTKYRALDLETLPYKVGEWNKAEFFYLTPRVFTREDNLVVYLYNRSSKSIYFDNFHIVSYENK